MGEAGVTGPLNQFELILANLVPTFDVAEYNALFLAFTLEEVLIAGPLRRF